MYIRTDWLKVPSRKTNTWLFKAEIWNQVQTCTSKDNQFPLLAVLNVHLKFRNIP